MLHEIVGFLGKLNPVRFASLHDEPLLHYSSVAGVEALPLASVHELIDSILPKFQDALTLRRHHREDFAVHLEGARAEAFPVFQADLSVSSPFSEIEAQAQLNLTRIVCLSGEHAKRLRALQARRRI